MSALLQQRPQLRLALMVHDEDAYAMTPTCGGAVNGVVIFGTLLDGLLSYFGSQFSSSFEFIFG